MSPRESEFYVGYLPTPPRHARAAWTAAALLLSAFFLLALTLARAQSFPGAGTWDTSGTARFEGELRLDPYPRLLTRDEHGAPLDAVLVEQGKFGATPRAAPFAGQRVSVRGGLVRWGARAVIELAGTPDDITTLSITPPPATAPTPPPRAVTLVGEIVDPKCYLGVMNPGFGKPHLACAELCIKGGIPPVLVVRQPGVAAPPEGACYLITTIDGKPANTLVRGLIGRAVRVEGQLRAGPDAWGTLAAERIEPVR